jgi:hypothetical protein
MHCKLFSLFKSKHQEDVHVCKQKIQEYVQTSQTTSDHMRIIIAQLSQDTEPN